MEALYHVGLNPDAPYDVVHLAGIEFPKTSERVTGYGASTQREKLPGTHVMLTPEKREAIKAAAAGKVFRMVPGNKGARAFLLSKEGSAGFGGKRRPYVPQPNDVDVGRYV